jgi:hypothetical protein
MRARLSTLVAVITIAVADQSACAEVTGNITTEAYSVNLEPGLWFLGSGDYLRVSAGATVGVGAGDPATDFLQHTKFTLGAGADLLCDTTDVTTVQPGNFGATSDALGYTVPNPHDMYYEAWVELYRFDTNLMDWVELDFKWEVFYSD